MNPKDIIVILALYIFIGVLVVDVEYERNRLEIQRDGTYWLLVALWFVVVASWDDHN